MSGVVTISIELELGWGVHDVGDYDHLSEGCRKERSYFDKLLRKCDQFDVPISFNTVGHLMLAECGGTHHGSYPDTWFCEDPGTDVKVDPAFYAPDIVEKIRPRAADHELCTHTFSHVLFDRMDRESVSQDLARAQRLHEEIDGRPTPSLVPPRHGEPSTEVLEENSIEIVRKAIDTGTETPAHRYLELLLEPPSLPEPRLVDGIVETYTTSYPSLVAPSLPGGQRNTHPGYKWLPLRLRQQLQRRRLQEITRRAVEEDAYVHLWCHLYDLSNEYQWPLVADIIEEFATYRNEGQLEILTMEALNDRIRGR